MRLRSSNICPADVDLINYYTVPECRPGKVGFGYFCEAGGGRIGTAVADADGVYECGTSSLADNCAPR